MTHKAFRPLLYLMRMLPKAANLGVSLSPLIHPDDQDLHKKIKWSALVVFSILASLAAAFQTDRTEPRLLSVNKPLPKDIQPAKSQLFLLAEKEPPPLKRQSAIRSIDIIGPTYGTLPAIPDDMSADVPRVVLAYTVNLLGLLAAIVPFASSIFLLFADNPIVFYGLASLVMTVVGAKNILCEWPATHDRLTRYTSNLSWPGALPASGLQLLLGTYARLDASIAGGSAANLIYQKALPDSLGFYRLLFALPVFLMIYFAIMTLNLAYDVQKGLLRFRDKISPTEFYRILRGGMSLSPPTRTCADVLARPLNGLERLLLELTPFLRNNMTWLSIITFAAYASRQTYLADKVSDRFDLNTWQTIVAFVICILGAVAPALSAIRLKTRVIPAEAPILQPSFVATVFERACCKKSPDLTLPHLADRADRAKRMQQGPAATSPALKS